VSDEERAYLDELTRRDRTTITDLMREAMRSYIHDHMSLQDHC